MIAICRESRDVTRDPSARYSFRVCICDFVSGTNPEKGRREGGSLIGQGLLAATV